MKTLLFIVGTLFLVSCTKQPPPEPEPPKKIESKPIAEVSNPIVEAAKVPEPVKPEPFNPLDKTEEEIIAHFGQPSSRLDVGETTLMYLKASYVLVDNKVTEVKAGAQAWQDTAQRFQPDSQPEVTAQKTDDSYQQEKRAKEIKLNELQRRLNTYKAQHANDRYFSRTYKDEVDGTINNLESEIRKLKNQ